MKLSTVTGVGVSSAVEKDEPVQIVEYRAAVSNDAGPISDLILTSQREFCFHEYTLDGQKLMLRVCGREAVRQYLERGDVYFVAEQAGTIIGVAGIWNNHHLAHNFVATQWHRRGISKRLWRLASAECMTRGNPGRFDLRASTYAIPVYKKWGFLQTGPTAMEHGIVSTPMELNIASPHKESLW